MNDYFANLSRYLRRGYPLRGAHFLAKNTTANGALFIELKADISNFEAGMKKVQYLVNRPITIRIHYSLLGLLCVLVSVIALIGLYVYLPDADNVVWWCATYVIALSLGVFGLFTIYDEHEAKAEVEKPT
jgi:hypothetical protein